MKKYKVEHQITINGLRKVFRGNSEREVRRKILEYEDTVRNSSTLDSIIEEWQKEHFPKLSPNTLHGYIAGSNKILDEFSGTFISDIEPSDIQRFVESLAMQGYAKKTVRNTLLVFNLVFKYAIIKGYTDKNCCQYISVPSSLPQTKRESLTPEEIQIIKDNKDKYFFPYFLLLTGLRLGEALALEKSDIDFENRRIIINKSLCWATKEPQIKSPKTEAGNRSVILLEPLVAPLKSFKRGILFPGKDGGYITRPQYCRKWSKMCKDLNTNVTAHQFRHTYASMLYDANIDVKDAQLLLGHAQISTTLDIYTHLKAERINADLDKLNSYVSK